MRDKDVETCKNYLNDLIANIKLLYGEAPSTKDLLVVVKELLAKKRQSFIEQHLGDETPATLRKCELLLKFVEHKTKPEKKTPGKRGRPRLVKTDLDRKG